MGIAALTRSRVTTVVILILLANVVIGAAVPSPFLSSVRDWADGLRGPDQPAQLQLEDGPAPSVDSQHCAHEAYAVLVTQHSTGSNSQKNFEGGASGTSTDKNGTTSVVRSQLRLVLVLVRSLRRVERCRRAVVLLLGTMVRLPAPMRGELSRLGVRIATVPPLVLGVALFDKLHAWRLAPRFERVAMLDADMMVLQPLDDLFARPEELLIARHPGGGMEQAQCGVPKERWGIGGFFVLRPSLRTFSALSAFAVGPLRKVPLHKTYGEQLLLPCYFGINASYTMEPRWMWHPSAEVSYKVRQCAGGMPPSPPPPTTTTTAMHDQRRAQRLADVGMDVGKGMDVGHAAVGMSTRRPISLEHEALMLAAANDSARIRSLSPYLQYCLKNIRSEHSSSVYKTCLRPPASRCLPQTAERMLYMCQPAPPTSQEHCDFGSVAGRVHTWHFKGDAKPWREAGDDAGCHTMASRGYLRLEGLEGLEGLKHSRRLASDDALLWRHTSASHHAAHANAGQTNAGQANAAHANAGQANAGQANAGQANAGQANASHHAGWACVSRLTRRRVLWAT